MKKILKAVWLSLAAALVLLVAAACADPALKEVAGTYEMTEIHGEMSGVTINESMYEYFRIILDEKGNGTVQSKAAGIGGVAYEAKGTYKYKDGKIYMTSKNGSASVTEEYDYADGVITYTLESAQMSFTVVLTRTDLIENQDAA